MTVSISRGERKPLNFKNVPEKNNTFRINIEYSRALNRGFLAHKTIEMTLKKAQGKKLWGPWTKRVNLKIRGPLCNAHFALPQIQH